MSIDSSVHPDVSRAPREVTLEKRVIVVYDLASFTRAAQGRDAIEVWAFLEDYYALCGDLIGGAGGRVVKFVGDACLAIFPPERCVEAVDAMTRLRAALPAVATRHRLPVSSGHANVHLATIAAGELGPPGLRRFDIIGEGVNHTFLMGGRLGPGVHVSEPVYRQLPNERRGAWRKQKPPSTYSLG